MISIGRMIHAPSRTTSSECLHFLPSRPRVPFPPLVLVSHSRRRSYAALAFRRPSSSSSFFFFCPTNSILAVVARTHFQSSPTFADIGVAFAYRFRCADTHESIRSPPFNITRSPRRFCPSRPDASPRVIRAADEERASPYQSLPPDRTRCGRKSRIIATAREDNGDGRNESKIDRLFPPRAPRLDEIITFPFKILWTLIVNR